MRLFRGMRPMWPWKVIGQRHVSWTEVLANAYYAGSVPGLTVDEQADLVALLREQPAGLNWTQLAGAVLEHGGAAAARELLMPDVLFADEEQQARAAEALRDIRYWLANGLEFWSIVDERYPARVRDIPEAPPFLFARGRRVDQDVAVSVVGSRNASGRGLRMASDISDALVAMDVTVVAGLAAGIDTAAHHTALERGGRTVAVIGTGINRSYPAANRDLQKRIADTGLLLSQFWPDAPPRRHHFPMRNAVMSGYGIATVVVEAGERSGARIQARTAVQHGRPVILTELVVNGTQWGRALVERPDVHVASSLDEITSVVRELVDRPKVLDEMLGRITVS